MARRDVAERVGGLRGHRRAVDGETGDVIARRGRDCDRGAVAPVDTLARRRDQAVGAGSGRDRVADRRRNRRGVVPVDVVGVTEVVGLQHQIVEPGAGGHVGVVGELRLIDERVVDVVADGVGIQLDTQVVPAVVAESGRESDHVPAQVVPDAEPVTVDEADDRIAGDAAVTVRGRRPQIGPAAVRGPVGTDIEVGRCERRARRQIVLAALRVVEGRVVARRAVARRVGGADRQLQPTATIEGRPRESGGSEPVGVPGARGLRGRQHGVVIEGLDRGEQ